MLVLLFESVNQPFDYIKLEPRIIILDNISTGYQSFPELDELVVPPRLFRQCGHVHCKFLDIYTHYVLPLKVD